MNCLHLLMIRVQGTGRALPRSRPGVGAFFYRGRTGSVIQSGCPHWCTTSPPARRLRRPAVPGLRIRRRIMFGHGVIPARSGYIEAPATATLCTSS